MSPSLPALREVPAPQPGEALAATRQFHEPVVMRGLVADWPLVSQPDFDAARDYLQGFYDGKPVTVFDADNDIGGRIFYTEALEQVNFRQSKANFRDVMQRLDPASSDGTTVYMGSTSIEHFFPGLERDNSLPLGDLRATVRIWIGNCSTVAAHYDAMENVACVCAGRRRFTLFPPDQVANLYVGPIDFTPAGQSVSLVDLDAPDFDRFPRFREALEHAKTAVLEPGDAIYIPALWWHHVAGLEDFNILINHWWMDAPAHVGPPLDALLHALLDIRDLPDDQRRAWQTLFEHYVFGDRDEVAAHIPEARRGALGEISDDLARKLRASLRNNLNR